MLLLFRTGVTHKNELWKIYKDQMADEWQVRQTSLHKNSFAAFAELCRGKGFVMTTLEAVGSVTRDALDHDGPTIVEVMTDAQLV